MDRRQALRSRSLPWGALVLLSLLTSCAGSHFRYVDSVGDLEEWSREVESYPLIDRRTQRDFGPVNPESVWVYYARIPGAVNDEHFRLGELGRVDRLAEKWLRVARIEVFRGPLPDHAGALRELKERAAALGADALTGVGYTVVVGDRYKGGSRLLGWVYRGDARRSTVELPQGEGES